MKEYLNTLYITREQSYLHLDHDTIRMKVGSETLFRMPLLHLSSIVCFGNILISPALIHRCAEDGRSLVLLDTNGQFKARLEGSTHGNVLLRRAQHLSLLKESTATAIARNCVVGKIQNSRQIILRAQREAASVDEKEQLQEAVLRLGTTIAQLKDSHNIDEIRGHEGIAAKNYFSVFTLLLKENREAFAFRERSRRPPLDRINALLSFAYTLLRHDCVSAIESVGLDPQVGYLHTLRPGRPALALDLMEELRPVLADRLILSLINRGQIRPEDFTEQVGGAVYLTDEARKKLLTVYQQRKQDEIQHRVVGKQLPVGLLPYIQARLLARHLREDVPEYLPFLHR